MTIINTGLMTKGLRSEFFNRFNETPTHYQDFATRIPSTSDHETYRWLGTVPNMREWGTGRLTRGLGVESWSVENLKYESTLEVDRDEIADDQTGQIRIRIAELAQRAATHKDYLIGELLAKGMNTGFNAYDGKTFFSTNHESGDSGEQSNMVTCEVDNAEAATATEFKASLQLALERMMTFRDDQGQPVVLSGNGFVCVVPPSLFFTASEAVNATLLNSSTNTMQGIARVVAFPWLTTGTTWYLLKTDGIIRPFIFQDREPIEFTSLAENSEEAFRREKYLFGVRARYRLTYGYWQHAVRVLLHGEK